MKVSRYIQYLTDFNTGGSFRRQTYKLFPRKYLPDRIPSVPGGKNRVQFSEPGAAQRARGMKFLKATLLPPRPGRGCCPLSHTAYG